MCPPSRWVVAVKHGVDVNLTRADPATGLIDLRHAPRKTSDFDKNAVEEAVRLREKHGGTVTAVTVGSASAREALRDAVALGADDAVLLSVPEESALDSSRVVTALAAYLRLPENGFDLLLLGEGSTDHFSGSVGPGVAGALERPSLSHVRHLSIQGAGVRVRRDLEQGVEEIEADLPAIVTVGQEINTPRLPTFLSTLKASKKEIREVPVASLGLPTPTGGSPASIREARLPRVPRKHLRVPGSDPSSVARELTTLLHQEGIDPA